MLPNFFHTQHLTITPSISKMIYLAGLRLFVFGVLLIVKKAGINSFPVKTSWSYILNYLEFPKSDLPGIIACINNP
jgi:hypothetical protein